MWDIILQHLPLIIILTIATIICGADLIKAIGVWKAKRKEVIDAKIKKKQEETELAETLKSFQEELIKINTKLNSQDARFTKIEEKLTALTESDMHDIKSWIVDQYHKFYVEQGWIDAFSADTIEHRYNDYKNEGGNSYIDQLMDRLHSLPMDPPPGFRRD